MKTPRLCLLAIFAFVVSTSVHAQDPHVHSKYLRATKTTVVQTDWMYLINTRDQFLQVGLITRYPGERLEKPLKKIDLMIWSFSMQPLYRQGTPPTLTITTNGEAWKIASTSYLVFTGETKNGQDIFWSEKRNMIGQPSVLPEEALVKSREGINGLYMERISIELTPQQLAKIARAAEVTMQLGASNVEFSISYLNTLRDLSARLTPGAQPSTEAKSSVTATAEPENIGVVNGRAISLPRPEYPSMAKASRASGSVNVLVTIDETGKVIAARALGGHPLLQEVSEAAARAARFSPTSVKGVPVKVSGIIVYNFVQ